MSAKDFTVRTYELLLAKLVECGYHFHTFEQHVTSTAPAPKNAILRHDVDDKHLNSLRFARIQFNRGIRATYYFRMIPASFNEKTMRQIHDMGHEVGYHYETMDTSRGNVDRAYEEFCANLEIMRKVVPVTTICMHGSPLSKYDNRDLWQKFDYRKLGIVGEPYFDLNFNEVFYLTDTGRKWDGGNVSVRDKTLNPSEIKNPAFLSQKYHTTFDIIAGLQSQRLPEQIMMNFHPQRWTDNMIEWYKELVVQNLKNEVKRILFVKKARNSRAKSI